MMRPAVLAAFAVMLAAGCAPAPSAPPGDARAAGGVTGAPDGTDECGAKASAGLVGKALSDPAVPPASPIVRHIRPGDAVTEDYRVERLNLYATEAGVIDRINCG
jgi:hypothetical protein